MSIRTGASALGMAAAIAAGSFAAGPQLAASEVEKGDLKIKFGLRLQGRIESAFGVKNAANQNSDIAAPAVAQDDRQDVDFYFRRIRFNMGGSWKNDTFFYLNLRMDGLGQHTTGFGSESANPSVHDAWVGHHIKTEGMTHTIRFGRQAQFFNGAALDSSARTLFPNGRPGSGHKNIGLAYKLTAPVFTAGLDVQNSVGDSREWVISARVETSLTEDMKMRRTESALGKEGFGHVLGVDVAHLTNSVTGNEGWTQFGIDYNIHFNAITAVLDFYYRTFDVSDADTFTISAQAGYAIPMDNGMVVEPALRIIYRDNDDASGVNQNPAAFEGINQGLQIDAGVNLYVNGHNNKFQFGISHWTADSGDGQKTVARLQHQINF